MKLVSSFSIIDLEGGGHLEKKHYFNYGGRFRRKWRTKIPTTPKNVKDVVSVIGSLFVGATQQCVCSINVNE